MRAGFLAAKLHENRVPGYMTEPAGRLNVSRSAVGVARGYLVALTIMTPQFSWCLE
jgi:hypothetical protein